MAKKTPDFRHMTPDDLREGIAVLNKTIKKLRAFQGQQNRRFVLTTGGGAVAAAIAAIIFPPAGAVVAMGTLLLNMDPATASAVSGLVLDDAIDLRAKFKEVYRARPGRAFHDVAGRIEKEKARKKKNRKFRFPGFS